MADIEQSSYEKLEGEIKLRGWDFRPTRLSTAAALAVQEAETAGGDALTPETFEKLALKHYQRLQERK